MQFILRAVAPRFKNVRPTDPKSAKGTWGCLRWTLPRITLLMPAGCSHALTPLTGQVPFAPKIGGLRRGQQPRQIVSRESRSRCLGSFGGTPGCISRWATSGGRSLIFGCRWPTGAGHAVAVGVCSGDANVVVASWEEAALTESARAATQIAVSRMISLQTFDCGRNVAVGS